MAGAAAPVSDSWEQENSLVNLPDLSKLDISDKQPASAAPQPDGATSSSAATNITAQVAAFHSSLSAEPVCDAAILEALKDPKERQNVVHLEELVESFINDPTKEVLEFPGNFSNYQRMLAHRVAQFYGLQTSTVDYEEGPGRVIGHRTKFTIIPKVRPSSFELKPGASSHPPHERSGGPRILRRASGGEIHRSGSGHDSLGGNTQRSLEEREEDYHKARERIIGGGRAGLQGSSRAGGGGGGSVGVGGGGRSGRGRPDGAASILDGGRGFGGGGGGGPDMGAGRGRGRKAVFRDRDRELSDPDYRRGVGRYANAGFDPNVPSIPGNMYNVPTYISEFPTLGRPTPGGHPAVADYRPDYPGGGWAAPPRPGGFHPPPPPPPPGGAGPHGAKAMSFSGYPSVAAGGPGGAGGAGAQAAAAAQAAMSAGAARPYGSMHHPGMVPAAMSPYPMPIAFHHPGAAMGQHPGAAMYGQYPAFYAAGPGMPPGSYGFVPSDGAMGPAYQMQPYAMGPGMGPPYTMHPGPAMYAMQGMPAGQMQPMGRMYSAPLPLNAAAQQQQLYGGGGSGTLMHGEYLQQQGGGGGGGGGGGERGGGGGGARHSASSSSHQHQQQPGASASGGSAAAKGGAPPLGSAAASK